jgi:hypothetical protein
MLQTMSYVVHVRCRARTMSYVLHVRHHISMSYVRHVRHRHIRCRTCIQYRRSDVRHRMLSSYTTSYVLTCISHVHAYNIAYDIAYDIAFDWIWSGVQGVQIACTIAQAQEFALQWIHSGIDRPTSGGRGRRPRDAIAAALAAASGPRADSSSSSARRRRGFEENVLAWTEGTRDQKSHHNFPHYSSVTSKLDTKCFLVRFPALFK